MASLSAPHDCWVWVYSGKTGWSREDGRLQIDWDDPLIWDDRLYLPPQCYPEGPMRQEAERQAAADRQARIKYQVMPSDKAPSTDGSS